jgi:putative PIN family toxin of toxin-antitoxin system
MELVRIVLDTAALVTAIRSKTGAAAELVRRILVGELTLLMDYKLVCEYRDVVLRSDHLLAAKMTATQVEEIINFLEVIATPVWVGARLRPLSRDEADDMVLDVAINGRADVVVTNNVRDFLPAADFGIRVLTPRDLLVELRQREASDES